MIRQIDFPYWPIDKIEQFNAHPMISKRLDDFFDAEHFIVLCNIMPNGRDCGYLQRMDAFCETMVINSHKPFDQKLFDKLMGFLDDYQLAFKKVMVKKRIDSMDGDFK